MSKEQVDFRQTLKRDRKSHLQQLNNFRKDPVIVVSLLNQRLSRLKCKINEQEKMYFLLSESHKKKAIYIHQDNPQQCIRTLIGIILGQTNTMEPVIEIPKLSEVASKLCQTILPQIQKQIRFNQKTASIIRQQLDTDSVLSYPNPVACVFSLGFDEPFESLITLLIDDGLPNRPNRKILLNPNFRYTGVASMKSEKNDGLRCTVYLFTDQIKSKDGRSLSNERSNFLQIKQKENSSVDRLYSFGGSSKDVGNTQIREGNPEKFHQNVQSQVFKEKDSETLRRQPYLAKTISIKSDISLSQMKNQRQKFSGVKNQDRSPSLVSIESPNQMKSNQKINWDHYGEDSRFQYNQKNQEKN